MGGITNVRKQLQKSDSQGNPHLRAGSAAKANSSNAFGMTLISPLPNSKLLRVGSNHKRKRNLVRAVNGQP